MLIWLIISAAMSTDPIDHLKCQKQRLLQVQLIQMPTASQHQFLLYLFHLLLTKVNQSHLRFLPGTPTTSSHCRQGNPPTGFHQLLGRYRLLVPYHLHPQSIVRDSSFLSSIKLCRALLRLQTGPERHMKDWWNELIISLLASEVLIPRMHRIHHCQPCHPSKRMSSSKT